jgi:DUF2997 family protein
LKTIEIVVDPKGEVVVQTKGFAGTSCKDASRFVERALGEVTGETSTAEMHQHAVASPQECRQRSGD